ncbi:MAG: carbohydrate-binding domain-containing protein [Bacteroidaceae bacterium]|nr:carbohydrate-binding domain-containing protein [Bacteroidaceae bacterium]
MKKIFFLAAIFLIVNCQLSIVKAQTFAIHSGSTTLLATPDEVGEMMFSGTYLSIGDTVLDVTDIDSMSYTTMKFDPLLVDFAYSGEQCRVTMPLALADSMWLEQDGAYVTVISAKKGGDEVVYTLSGTTANGCFKQEGEYKCKVRLNGVNITSQRGAAVHIKNGKRIHVDVANGTVNNFVDHADTLHDACFHVKGHPEFYGLGTINITGNGKHGFKSGEYTELKDSLGTINILSAPADGIHASQYFKMKGGTVNIYPAVKGDGIQAECDKDSTKLYNGQLFLRGGTVNIEISGDSCEGLKCDSLMTISGGTHNVTCNGLFSKCISAGTSMVMYEKKSKPVVTLINNGGYVVVQDKNKKSVCLKVEKDFFFHTGTLSLTADEDVKGKSANIGNDYIYVSKAVTLTAKPAMDVDGAIRVKKTEADMIAYEEGKGIYISTLDDEEDE